MEWWKKAILCEWINERWNSGKIKDWKIEMVEHWFSHVPTNILSLQHSILHYSNIPLMQHSILPQFHHPWAWAKTTANFSSVRNSPTALPSVKNAPSEFS
jgi:hypothetical protein